MAFKASQTYSDSYNEIEDVKYTLKSFLIHYENTAADFDKDIYTAKFWEKVSMQGANKITNRDGEQAVVAPGLDTMDPFSVLETTRGGARRWKIQSYCSRFCGYGPEGPRQSRAF